MGHMQKAEDSVEAAEIWVDADRDKAVAHAQIAIARATIANAAANAAIAILLAGESSVRLSAQATTDEERDNIKKRFNEIVDEMEAL